MVLVAGTRLGHYEIVDLLGAGGMGEVYRARDTRLARVVAIKLIAGLADERARAHLLQEARAAAALNHAHICTIHEIGDADDRLFIVMEYIDGRLLSDLATEGVPPATAIRYGIQIADALAHAHDRGVVHRDLKSANLMVASDGRVKVLDFGIARRFEEAGVDAPARVATMTGMVTGTPAYMAPEALRGAPIDRRSDIWALGVVLYEIVAGRRPFGGETAFDISSAILRDEPEPLASHVPAPLGTVISRCLAKDPALRYQHAGEIRAALEASAVSSSTTPEHVVQTQPATSTSFTSEKSIIVLPFASHSPDPDDEYFGDGLTDELVTDLSRIANLRVVPSATSFRLKNVNKDLSTIARESNARYVVEGRVRKAGRNVRITAQLVDAWDNRTMWADKYTGELEDVFELQERVSRAIADALQLQLRPGPRAPKPEAAEAYLKGRHFARQATSAGLQRAVQCFQHATEIDPNCAAAFAALADTYVTLTTGWDTLPARDTMPKADAAARRALELDPELADAHVARALVAMFYEWDLQTAERFFKEALRLNPDNADAHKRYAVLLIWLDTRYDEALSHVLRAASLDPDPWIQAEEIWVHTFSRDFDRGIERGRRLTAAEPLYSLGHYSLGVALLCAGRAEEATVSLTRAIELDGRTAHHVGLLGFAHAVAGRQDTAFDCLSELDALERAGKDVATWKLHVYAGLADADQVIRCLEVAVERRSSSTLFVLTHPFMDFVRQDPRFVALLQKVGLGYLTTRRWQTEWKPR